MSLHFKPFWRRSRATTTSTPPVPAGSDLLAEARALAQAGKIQEASDTYWKIKRKHRTVAGLIEHAQLLLELGDSYGAAAMAVNALEVEPENAEAKAIQARIRRSERG